MCSNVLYRPWTDYGNLSEWYHEFDRVLDWFNGNEATNFVAWYIDQPDHSLHNHGFYLNETINEIDNINTLFGYILQQIDRFDLQDRLNIIVTADHGHAQITKV
jgi:predicted AlkP superfamily pyrophosphatase or phosphodiesterase